MRQLPIYRARMISILALMAAALQALALLGSDAELVLRASRVPVLVVPGGTR